jgi:hypothetical protein
MQAGKYGFYSSALREGEFKYMYARPDVDLGNKMTKYSYRTF